MLATVGGLEALMLRLMELLTLSSVFMLILSVCVSGLPG